MGKINNFNTLRTIGYSAHHHLVVFPAMALVLVLPAITGFVIDPMMTTVFWCFAVFGLLLGLSVPAWLGIMHLCDIERSFGPQVRAEAFKRFSLMASGDINHFNLSEVIAECSGPALSKSH